MLNREECFRHAGHAHRRGFGLLLTIGVLMLVSLLLGSLVLQAEQIYLRKRQDVQQQQAYWLVESATERAAWRLARDPSYRGETWNVSPASLGGRYGGQVRITVIPAPEEGASAGVQSVWTIRVQAAYPRDVVRQVSLRKDVPIVRT